MLRTMRRARPRSKRDILASLLCCARMRGGKTTATNTLRHTAGTPRAFHRIPPSRGLDYIWCAMDIFQCAAHCKKISRLAALISNVKELRGEIRRFDPALSERHVASQMQKPCAGSVWPARRAPQKDGS